MIVSTDTLNVKNKKKKTFSDLILFEFSFSVTVDDNKKKILKWNKNVLGALFHWSWSSGWNHSYNQHFIDYFFFPIYFLHSPLGNNWHREKYSIFNQILHRIVWLAYFMSCIHISTMRTDWEQWHPAHSFHWYYCYYFAWKHK